MKDITKIDLIDLLDDYDLNFISRAELHRELKRRIDNAL